MSIYSGEHDYDFDEMMSESGMTSVASNIKKQRQMMDDYKKIDKGYNKIYRMHNIKRTILDSDRRTPIDVFEKKRISIEFYTTNFTPGTKIREATCGNRENDLFVGKTDEDLFFKVILATGELGQTPYSTLMFFYSPEEYERHFHCSVSEDIKNKWKDKYIGEKMYRDKCSEEKKLLQKKFTIIK